MIYPAHHSLGSAANVSTHDIPEAEKALHVINHWVEDRLFSLKSRLPKSYFINALIQMSSLAFTLNKTRAQKYLRRIPCVLWEPAQQYLRENDQNIVSDILEVLDGSVKHSVVVGILALKYVALPHLTQSFHNFGLGTLYQTSCKWT